jgi:hypothetical protein
VREEGRDDATSPRVSASSSGEVCALESNDGVAPVIGDDGENADDVRRSTAGSYAWSVAT